MLRRLRIAASLFFALVTVAIAALWIRSYFKNEIVCRLDPPGQLTTIGSNYGIAYFYRETLFRRNIIGSYPPKPHGWEFDSHQSGIQSARFKLISDVGHFEVKMPYYALAVVSVALTAAPWIKRRFSYVGACQV
jgi:hypothetical protein